MFFVFVFVLAMLGIKSRALPMLDKLSTAELHPSPGVSFFLSVHISLMLYKAKMLVLHVSFHFKWIYAFEIIFCDIFQTPEIFL